MDIQTIMQAVGSLGFPIVMCIMLLWYLNQERESHKEEMNSMKDALDRNTVIMTELKEMLKIMTGVDHNDAGKA